MLSKLFYCQNDSAVSADLERLRSALIKALQADYINVNVESCRPGGTLGLFFYANLDGDRKFIKTHLPGVSQRDNLVKEIAILQILYGDILFIKKLELLVEEVEHVFLMMDTLELVPEKPNIEIIREIINEYNSKLNYVEKGDIKSLFSYLQVCDEAIHATEFLASERLISMEIAHQTLWNIQRLAETTSPFLLCHGDLSNNNIMQKNGINIVVDWEDALWGIRNYDLYYWLTFFDQRQYYSLIELKKYQIDIDECISSMTTIIITKSYLSYINGSSYNHSISIDRRMAEVFNVAKI